MKRVLVQHRMPVVDVAALLTDLALPLVLLVRHPVENVATRSHLLRRPAERALVILVGVFLVGCLGSLVDERVEADEEAHVHHQQHNHPNHYDHYHLDNSSVPVFILAFTAWTELLLSTLDLVTHTWQDHRFTVAFVRLYVGRFHERASISSSCVVEHSGRARADTFTAIIFI